MTIKELTAAIRKNVIEQSDPNISTARLVYLSDKHWDLTARYETIIRQQKEKTGA